MSLSLLELVPPERWQRLQEHFTRVLGIPIRTVGRGHELLATPTWLDGVETERLIALLKVGEELDRLLPLDRPPADVVTLVTPLGVSYAAVPIRPTASPPIAYVVAGPMLVGPREDQDRFRQRVGALGLDPAALWPIMLSLRLFSFVSIRSALGLVEEVSNAIAQLAYQLAQLKTLAPVGSAVEEAVATYQASRIFQALLDAAVLATQADGGSVMVYDRDREALTISAAQGLAPGVIAEARVRRGEGIAGLAVAERRTLVVDEQATEPVRSRMRRPELASSLVVPLAPDGQHEPLGTLNLWSLDPARRFSAEHQELLRRLLALAYLAIRSLR